MEKANKKIELSSKKRLGEILSETYNLMSSNPKLVLKLVVWAVIPMVLLSYVMCFVPSIQQYIFFYLTEGNPLYLASASIGVTMAFGIMALLFLIYLKTVPFTFLRCYIKQQEGVSLSSCHVVRFAWKDTLRYLPLEILLCIGILLTCPIMIYTIVPLFMVQACFLAQRISYWQAIKEGFSLGTRYWARTIVGGLLVALIIYIIELIFSLPFFLTVYAFFIATLSSLEGNEAALPGYFNIMLFLFIVLMQLAYAFCTFFSSTALALHFFNLKARRQEKLLQRITEEE